MKTQQSKENWRHHSKYGSGDGHYSLVKQTDTPRGLTSIVLEVLLVAVYILFLSNRRENEVVKASSRAQGVACIAVVINNQQLGS
jgi:hypothetical protein